MTETASPAHSLLPVLLRIADALERQAPPRPPAPDLAAADAFVFPSRTDTFGLVLLEALACGTPVAAYPVTGPLDVIGDAPVGVLSEDLGKAARIALTLDRAACRRHAQGFSWSTSATQFARNLMPT